MKKTATAILCILLLAGTVSPAQAANSEADEAAAFVTRSGIFTGDSGGDLHLDDRLTRAELAVILTRIDYIANTPRGLSEWDDWGFEHFSNPETRLNTFTDVPDWALPYVEYCYQGSFMKGVGGDIFDPNGRVTPQMACTVILRFCRIAETDWNYNTSVQKAQTLGIAPADGVGGDTLLRGTMAVLIHKGIKYDNADAPILTEAPEAVSPQEVTTDDAEQAPMTVEEMRAEIVRLTNAERVKAGVPELETLPELMDSAQAKAQDMMDNDYYDHYSPVYGSPGDMIRDFVTISVALSGENISNIAPWANPTKHIMDGWMRSPGHHGNMLIEDYTYIGVGVVVDAKGGYYCVQQFIAP